MTEPSTLSAPSKRSSGRARPAWLVPAVMAVLLLAAFWTGLSLGDVPTAETETTAQVAYTCPMHPQIRKSEPGQCPVCGMDLVSAESGVRSGASHTVHLSDEAQALAQIRTSRVTRVDPRTERRLLGRVDYDETRFRMITAWTAGRIDRLHVRATGVKIDRGQTVATLYSPEVYAAMRDLATAAKQVGRLQRGTLGSGRLAGAALEAARERLRLLGVSQAQIDSIEKGRKAPKGIRVRAPYGGTVLDRKVEQGDYVQAGTVLYHIADLTRVWVQIDAYESDLPLLAVDNPVTLTVNSLPGETFEGKVAFIDPVVDPTTRTARVRVEVDNASGQLRPGMFAEAVIESNVGEGGMLTIPATAPLFTGRRSVVYVEVPGQDGHYALREVKLGPKSGPLYPVLSGLTENDRVVTHGAFVIDADLQLQGGRSMMTMSDDRATVEDAVAASPEVLASLSPVVERYIVAQVALAGDDFDGGRKALEALAETTNAVSFSAPKDTRRVWEDIASAIVGNAREAANAPEAEVRTRFENVSDAVVRILRRFGNPTESTVLVAYCPMAFDHEGAQWVQHDTTLANPYYGAAMLQCGDTRATLIPGERMPTAVSP